MPTTEQHAMPRTEQNPLPSGDQQTPSPAERNLMLSEKEMKTQTAERATPAQPEQKPTAGSEAKNIPAAGSTAGASSPRSAATAAVQASDSSEQERPARTWEHRRLKLVERHNLINNIAEGGVYISSSAFVSPQTVMPALLTRLGGTNVEIGLLSVLTYVGAYIPQLFAARYVETLPWKKRWSVTFGTAQRSFVLLMGLLVLLFGEYRNKSVLWGFLLLFFFNFVVGGIATPGWFDLFAKLTSAKKRGRLVGIRNSLGGLGAFLGGFVLTWLLATFAFPVNYAVGFFIAFVLQMTSVVIQMRLIETDPSPVVPRRPMVMFLRELPGLLKANREFSRFLVASAFLVVAMVPSGFFTVYALRDFPLRGYPVDDMMVGQYTLAMVAIQVVGALVVGFVTDRYGTKLALLCTSGAMLLSSAWALLAPTPGWFTLVYIFFGITLGGEMMVRFNMAIEYCPPQLRSSYVGLMNTALAPCYLAGLAGGVISDAVGYKGVFVLGMLASFIGIYLLVTIVRDPREAAA